MAIQRLSGEDKAVIFFSLLGFVGSPVLYYLKFPSVMVALFLSAGVTALLYRFLGGVQGATFTVGALKVGGAAAVLIGVAYWLDGTKELAPRHVFRLSSEDRITGTWNWKSVGPSMGWNGTLTFARAGNNLIFTGDEYSLEAVPGGGAKTNRILQMTNGKATLSDDGTSLTLESDVQDFRFDRKFHWKSETPLALIPSFGGQLWPKILPGAAIDPGLESQPWGILITKDTAR